MRENRCQTKDCRTKGACSDPLCSLLNSSNGQWSVRRERSALIWCEAKLSPPILLGLLSRIWPCTIQEGQKRIPVILLWILIMPCRQFSSFIESSTCEQRKVRADSLKQWLNILINVQCALKMRRLSIKMQTGFCFFLLHSASTGVSKHNLLSITVQDICTAAPLQQPDHPTWQGGMKVGHFWKSI